MNVREINEQVKNNKKKRRKKRKDGRADRAGGREKQRRRKEPSWRGKLIARCRLLAGCTATEAAVVPAWGGCCRRRESGEQRAADLC